VIVRVQRLIRGFSHVADIHAEVFHRLAELLFFEPGIADIIVSNGLINTLARVFSYPKCFVQKI
jgi:hypothetical protein